MSEMIQYFSLKNPKHKIRDGCNKGLFSGYFPQLVYKLSENTENARHKLRRFEPRDAYFDPTTYLVWRYNKIWSKLKKYDYLLEIKKTYSTAQFCVKAENTYIILW